MRPNSHLAARFALAACVLIGLCAGATAHAQHYTFTPIDYFSGPYQGFASRPTLNDGGVLAYRAIRTGGFEGIYRGSGGPVTLISTPLQGAAYSSFNVGPSINDAGVVLFRSGVNNGNNGVFIGTGGPVSYVYSDNDPYPFYNFGFNPSLNNAGRIGSQARLKAGGTAIMSGDGGPPTTIATSPSSLFGFGQNPSINEAGVVAFQSLDLNGQPVSIQKGSGGPLTTLISVGGAITGVDSPVVNDSGVVAFREMLSGGEERIAYSSDGITVTPFADTLGPIDSFGLDGSLDINDVGEIAFFGRLNNNQEGIFTGLDVANNYVIRAGDPLDGSFVSTLDFFRGGLNDKGQIAFYATLSDGRAGVFRADPIHTTFVPESSSLVLLTGGLLVPVSAFLYRRRKCSR